MALDRPTLVELRWAIERRLRLAGRRQRREVAVPGVERVDVSLAIQPEQVRIGRLLHLGPEVDLFALADGQSAGLLLGYPPYSRPMHLYDQLGGQGCRHGLICGKFTARPLLPLPVRHPR